MIKTCSVCQRPFDGHKHKKTCSSDCAHLAQANAVRHRMVVDNPMKNLATANKASKTRSLKFQNDPAFKDLVATYTRKAWADGKFDGVKHGRCKWYSHLTPSKEIIKLQGKWEVVLATWFDMNDIQYDAHRGRIAYIDDVGIERSYYPDFFIPAFNCYVDVKGSFFDDLQKRKFELIKNSNPTLTVVLFNKQMFTSIGIDVIKESKRIC